MDEHGEKPGMEPESESIYGVDMGYVKGGDAGTMVTTPSGILCGIACQATMAAFIEPPHPPHDDCPGNLEGGPKVHWEKMGLLSVEMEHYGCTCDPDDPGTTMVKEDGEDVVFWRGGMHVKQMCMMIPVPMIDALISALEDMKEGPDAINEKGKKWEDDQIGKFYQMLDQAADEWPDADGDERGMG